MRTILLITKRELASYFKSTVALITVIVFIASLNTLFMRILFLEKQTGMRAFFGMLPWFFLFLVPALTMRLWAEEKRQGTLETLLTLPIKNHQLVIGKFLAAWGLICLTLTLTLTIPVSLSFLGNLDWGPVIGGYLGAAWLGGALTAIGLFSSGLSVNQVNSFVVGVFLSFSLIIIGENFVISALPYSWGIYLEKFGLTAHYQGLAKGVLDFRDLFYFLTISFFFLYLNYHSLQIRKWKTTGKLKTLSQVWIILGVIVLLNLLADKYSCRADLTERNEYSLSQASKNLFKDLKDPVRVKLFFSSDLPPALMRISRRVIDMLEEYQAGAREKLSFEILRPDLDKDAALLAQELGIPEVQFNVIRKDRAQIQKAYLGIAVYHEDRFSTISLITNETGLEYELSSAISKAVTAYTPTIGFWAGLKGLGISGRYRVIAAELQKRYKVTEVNLKDKQKVPEKIDTLVIVRPTEVSNDNLAAIDQFIMKGGKTVWLVDTVAFTGDGMFTRKQQSGVLNYLKHFGVEIKERTVLDGTNANAAFNVGGRQVRSAYPLWPLVTSPFMDRSHPVMSRLESLVLPWTSPLALSGDKLKGKSVFRLAFSSKNSWSEMMTGEDFSPKSHYNPRPGTGTGSSLLAAVIGGEFDSFFEKDSLPPGVLAEDISRNKSRPTHLAVIGNSNLLLNNIIRNYPSNAVFFLNLMDWLNSGEELLAIRAKTDTSRPLNRISESGKLWFRLGNIFMVPLLIVLVNGILFIIKRSK